MGAGFCFNFGRGLAAFAPLLLSSIASSYSLALGLLVCAGFFAVATLCMFFMPVDEAIGAKNSNELPATSS
ncbi:hypothetical protein D3C75_1247800 [compost metagenome]